MDVRQITVPVPGNAPAILILPRPMPADSLGPLEQAIGGMLSELRRELDDDAAERGRLEYESWIGQLRAARV
jgi:hypothetical protein